MFKSQAIWFHPGKSILWHGFFCISCLSFLNILFIHLICPLDYVAVILDIFSVKLFTNPSQSHNFWWILINGRRWFWYSSYVKKTYKYIGLYVNIKTCIYIKWEFLKYLLDCKYYKYKRWIIYSGKVSIAFAFVNNLIYFYISIAISWIGIKIFQ